LGAAIAYCQVPHWQAALLTPANILGGSARVNQRLLHFCDLA
jgi:hypothetical protein